MKKVLSYARSHHDSFLEQLKEFLRIPSISAQKEHTEDMKKCALYLQKHLESLGVSARVEETKGHPIVYGETIQDSKLPTLLIYGHYDVQPSDPDQDWTSPPFEPAVRDGRLYARGSTDDKGQVWIHIAALESFLKSGEKLPANLKFCIEGEEEIGSPNLVPFFQKNKKKLQADAMLISDTPMVEKNLPTITYGLRGLIYFEIEVQSVHQDLHSGGYGGSVDNPCHVLSRMIASLHNEKGAVNIPGFYADVRDLSEEEKEMDRQIPMDEKKYADSLSARKLWGEEGYSILERISSRPTLDVNGIWGGYTQGGAKTIIPAKASAKISMRLVANQDPKKTAELFKKHIEKICPDTVSLKIIEHESNIYPYCAEIHHPIFQVAKDALQKAFSKKEVLFLRQGGSIPFVPVVAKTLKVPCLLLGFGLPGENAHSPNEWFDLENFEKGIETMIYFYDFLKKAKLSS